MTKGTHPKPSVTMTVSDGASTMPPTSLYVLVGIARRRSDQVLMVAETFTELAEGKVNGQKAFMTGKLKLKGDVMLAVSFHRWH